MILATIFTLSATLATGLLGYWLWAKFTSAEVRQNAAAILANGSADDLRKGFHQRETWSRFWPWIGCCLLGAAPMKLAGTLPFLLAFAALGLLLVGYFARYFSPMLNEARGLPAWRASSDSASWPDAAIWKGLRKQYEHAYADSQLQTEADARLRVLLERTWGWCRLGAGVLALGAAVALLK